MKEGWTDKTLGEVCKIYNGNSINADYKKKHFLGATEGLPFIATKDVSPLGRIDYNNGVRIPNYEEYKVAPANSVFICAEGGSAGKKFAYVEKDVCFGNKLFCITPKDKSITGKFVYHFVQSDNFRGQFFSLLTGLIGGVSAKKFQTIRISVPPLSEQQSMVDYLDSAFAKIDAMKANAEKALNEAKALFQASLKEMLEPKEGWEEKTLKEITTKISDGSHNPPAGVVFSEYEMLSSKNVRNDIFNFDNPRYLSKEDFEKEDKRTNLEKGDVLLTIVGAGLGECCVYDFEKKIVFQRSVSVIKPFYDKIISRFLMYTLQNNYNNIRNASNGAAQKGIYLKQLAEYVVLIPPLSEQQSIVNTLDSLKSKVDRLQENYNKISQECDALKQAILRKVFE